MVRRMKIIGIPDEGVSIEDILPVDCENVSREVRAAVEALQSDLVRARQDSIRMREALLHIALQLDDTTSLVLERIPHCVQFARDIAEGGAKRPGFDEFIRD